MAWSTIRKASNDDAARLAAASDRFYNRYHIIGENLEIESGEFVQDEQGALWLRGRMLTRWRGYVARALRSPAAEGIAYGYVGYHAD